MSLATLEIFGGLSKLWSLFGSLFLGDPKRGHNFDNPPFVKIIAPGSNWDAIMFSLRRRL